MSCPSNQLAEKGNTFLLYPNNDNYCRRNNDKLPNQENLINDDNLNIENYERSTIKNLRSNREKNNNLYYKINKNKYNPYIIPSFSSEKPESSKFDIRYIFDFKKDSNNYNDISDKEFFTPTKTTQTKTKTKKDLFVISGKKKDRCEINIAENNKKRRKFDDDNINRKIKIHYINSTIGILNIILEELSKKNHIKFDSKFYKLNHKDKNKYQKKKFNIDFVQKTIRDIIESKISPQYSKKNVNSNKETCELIKKELKLRDMNIILNKNILFFFDKIYKEERKEEYNLNVFGLTDLKFVLPKKVELLEDLISKNKKDVQFNEYKKRIKECCDNYFKLNPLFQVKNENV